MKNKLVVSKMIEFKKEIIEEVKIGNRIFFVYENIEFNYGLAYLNTETKEVIYSKCNNYGRITFFPSPNKDKIRIIVLEMKEEEGKYDLLDENFNSVLEDKVNNILDIYYIQKVEWIDNDRYLYSTLEYESNGDNLATEIQKVLDEKGNIVYVIQDKNIENFFYEDGFLVMNELKYIIENEKEDIKLIRYNLKTKKKLIIEEDVSYLYFFDKIDGKIIYVFLNTQDKHFHIKNIYGKTIKRIDRRSIKGKYISFKKGDDNKSIKLIVETDNKNYIGYETIYEETIKITL